MPARPLLKPLLILAWLTSATLVRAADANPTVDQILDRYVESMGGKAALERLKTRVLKGEVEMVSLGVKGKLEVQNKVPNLQTSKIEFDGFGTMREGYDGKVAWSAAPFQGVTEKKGGELARVQRTTWFPRELKVKESYNRMEAKGAAKLGGTEAWVVEGWPSAGKPDRLFFDKKTGLLVREESTVETALGVMTFEIEYGDYREVDGVKVPHEHRIPKPETLNLRITVNEVVHNADLKDSVFEKPKS
jgi:zinc protease